MNIKRVAEEAGVSVATVSRVLNNSEKVASETKEKIKKIIEEMNYFPNVNAKVLREKRSKIILICVPDITNIIYSRMAKGILDYLAKNGYKGMIHISGYKSDISEYIYMFETKKIDGIISVTSSISEENYKILNEKYNIVTCSEYFENEGFETIGINQYNAMYLLMDYLFRKKNIKNPLYYTWENPTGTSKRRVKAYTDYLKENNVKKTENNLREIDFKNLEKNLKEDLTKNESIDALILNSDFYAVFAKKIADEIGKKIYVASFDGTQLLKMASEDIIHIKQPFEKMGKVSAETLLKKINHEKYQKKRYLSYELVDKDYRNEIKE